MKMKNEYRLIDAKPLMKNGWHLVQTGESNRFLRSMSLADVPIVDAAPVIHGKPVPHYQTWCNSDGKPVATYQIGYECPFCGDDGIKKFCPNCGAKMDGERKDNGT